MVEYLFYSNLSAFQKCWRCVRVSLRNVKPRHHFCPLPTAIGREQCIEFMYIYSFDVLYDYAHSFVLKLQQLLREDNTLSHPH
jgi:hypothetical protein